MMDQYALPPSIIALFIDFEKAFDSLEWDFLRKTLVTFQFGHEFKSWVKILYTNITSCTINNGYASNWFELHCGVRQGCPLSGLLFVLSVEILSVAIRASGDIKGIQIANQEIKLSQYVELIKILQSFARIYSRLKNCWIY